ncbi:hypothetical protein CN378_11785 [Bacillus sp. AFS015802]|uniref:IucA/IucC family protein n=1 Tax=Bacillus sp. AFS015802 TaxID=2033486 RepID=UPI000BF58197|nr:IucA/IucC family protein [Bacillus sp. AFS015802]PFA67056.1 hypothetical protein CN378_11785 [Bacillus sp. AFS015802]
MSRVYSYHSLPKESTNVEDLVKEKGQLSQRRILHKLIQAIIREELIEYTHGMTGDKKKFIYITPVENSKITIPIENTYMLGHLDIGGPITITKGNTTLPIETPTQFMKELLEGRTSRSHQFQLFIKELENSVENDSLALTAETLRKDHYTGEGTFEYLHNRSLEPSFSPLAFLEQSVIEGHTLHPCSKTRLGLSREEVISYAPEWGREVSIIPLAIHKSISVFTKIAGGPSMTDILLNEYPEVATAMKQQFTLLRRNIEEYEIIPVHPWQFDHTVKQYYQEEMKQQLLIPVDAVIPYRPLISFRSLAPDSRKHHHLKTALNVQMTSAKRIVSPTSVWNGPVISEILNDIWDHDKEINKRIYFLSECGGGHYFSQRKNASIHLEKNLSALVRENPEMKLIRGEIAVPGAALINVSPISGKLLAKELIEDWSTHKGISIETAAVDFIQQYANTLVPGLIALIVKYGISLEAHLQNALIVFEQGSPRKLLIRDNGGIRILEKRLPAFVERGRICNETNILTSEPVDLYHMFSHAVLHNHLGEIIVRVTKEFGLQEALLWRQVSNVVGGTIERLESEKPHKRDVSHFEQFVFGRSTYLKSLINMRLSDSFTENVYVSAPNPLTAGKGE